MNTFGVFTQRTAILHMTDPPTSKELQRTPSLLHPPKDTGLQRTAAAAIAIELIEGHATRIPKELGERTHRTDETGMIFDDFRRGPLSCNKQIPIAIPVLLAAAAAIALVLPLQYSPLPSGPGT